MCKSGHTQVGLGDVEAYEAGTCQVRLQQGPRQGLNVSLKSALRAAGSVWWPTPGAPRRRERSSRLRLMRATASKRSSICPALMAFSGQLQPRISAPKWAAKSL